MRLLRLVLSGLAVLTYAATGRTDDLPPAGRPIESVVDQFVDAKMAADKVTPAELADDATLVRRLTLDLVGRIPTVGETDAYLKSTDADKRTKLIDRLMASTAFDRHQAIQFDVMLNGELARQGRGSVRDYLTQAMKDRKPWDQIFRELMLPGDTDATKAAGEFLRARVTDADKMTNDVSVAFFGVNVSCAQCHDHPLVKDWKQDHFFGMKSFLARTYEAGNFVAERDAGVVKFKPIKGPEKTAKLMFLTGAVVETDTLRELSKDEQKKEKEAADKKKDKTATAAPPRPKFSAREKLVEVALQPKEAEFFSRSIVNRLWHRFFGSGLVNPLDQMHSENPASHPDLLKWLARDLAAHKYDLRRLVRGIVMSKAYSRDSRYSSESRPEDKYFAVAKLKPLTPQQLATSLKIATTDPKSFEGLKESEFEKRIEQAEQAGRGLASLIAQPTDNFQIGVAEALLFSNGDRVAKEYLTDGGGTLLAAAKAAKEPTDAVALLVRTSMARPAGDDEVKALTAYATERKDRAADAYKQILWALVTCPEFRFCH
ncbi:DUF1549 domain-containing protein [Limnoglobus roseus]|uniref:DUF1549 domain-containing protein n=1 Tax=Limnoglobus roseus TaxID=2598579 RepID=A0A5C1AD38_9BACT|nr:DUF1549 domain-containing protein [Limnoglobus roseus]QEL15916.1 hypothetical protein PX52LOC_02852 [Limnoglobus roseus]